MPTDLFCGERPVVNSEFIDLSDEFVFSATSYFESNEHLGGRDGASEDRLA